MQGTVNPSSSDFAGSSPAAPNNKPTLGGFFYWGEEAKIKNSIRKNTSKIYAAIFVPMRVGQSKEVATAIEFLLSEDAGFIFHKLLFESQE